MTNKLTDSRIAALLDCVEMCEDMSVDENAEMAEALRELQERRKADNQEQPVPVVPEEGPAELSYAQVKAVADLFALCWQSGEVVTYTPDPEKAIIWLNNYSGTCVQEYVKLEDALETESAELQERRKDSADPFCYLNRFTGRTFELEQQPGADRDPEVYIPLYAAQPVPVVPEEIPAGLAGQIVSLLAHNIGDKFLAQKIWNACRAAMLNGGKSCQAGFDAKHALFEVAIARFSKMNEGFPIKRFKADWVISWMLENFPPVAQKQGDN